MAAAAPGAGVITAFDRFRAPRALSDNTVSVPVRALNANLSCPICLGIMRRTHVVGECLHRFCHECITQCLRVSKKECPSCRTRIPSKRNLRPDPEFDALVQALYPNLGEFLSEEDRLTEEYNQKKHRDHEEYTAEVLSRVAKQEEVQRLHRPRLPAPPPKRARRGGGGSSSGGGGAAAASAAAAAAAAEATRKAQAQAQQVSVEVESDGYDSDVDVVAVTLKHPLESGLHELLNPLIHTPPTVTVAMFKLYLYKQLGRMDLTLCAQFTEDGPLVVVPDWATLADVAAHTEMDVLMIYYAAASTMAEAGLG